MGEELASLTALIGADLTGLKSGLTQTENMLRQTASKMSGIGRGMAQSVFGAFTDSAKVTAQQIESVGKTMTLGMAPVGLALGAASKIAMDFEDAMTDVRIRTGATADELKIMSNFALEMGRTTKYSAKQAAGGLLQLVTGGLDAKSAMQALPGILNAAAAEGLDLARVADSVTDVMSAFGLQAGKATYVSNLLAKASGSSTATMEGLFQGIANVGGVAKQFGLGLEDTVAALAIFSDQGIKGAEAGTQLKSMLLNMYRPTDDVRAAWDSLGIKLHTAEGKIRPLNQVMAEMSQALGKLSDEKRNEILQKIGGSFGILGLGALLAAGGTGMMVDKMDAAVGAAEMAAGKTETVRGKFEKLQSGIEEVATKALGPFNKEVLGPLAEGLTGIVGNVSDFVEANPELTLSLLKVAGVALLAGPLLTIVGKGLGMLGITGLGAGLGLALAAAKLGLLYTGLQLLSDLWNSDFAKTGLGAWKGVFENLGIIVGKIKEDVTGTKDVLAQTSLGDVGKFAEWEKKATGKVSDRTQADVQVKSLIDLTGAWAQGARNFTQAIIDFSEGFTSPGEMLKVDMSGIERLWITIADVADRELTKRAAATATANYMATQGGYGSTGIGMTAAKKAGLESDTGAVGIGSEVIKASEKEVDTSVLRVQKKLEETYGPTGVIVTSTNQGMDLVFKEISAKQEAIAGAFAGLTPKLISPFTDWLKTIGTLLMKVGGVSGLSLIGQVGAGIIGAIAGLSPRAAGGMVAQGSGYIVGERGPELFVPDVSGRIVPRLSGGSGGPVTVNLYANGINDPVRLTDMIKRELHRRNEF